MTTAHVSDPQGEHASLARPEPEALLLRKVAEYRDAYAARDVDRVLALFADDAEVVLAPGSFRGKDAIRAVLEWDARLSPAASVRDAGIGMVACGRTVVSERVISLSYRGIPYEEEAATIYEFDDGARITRMRSYYDKLALMHRIASRHPGLQGWLFRKLTGYLVAQGSKGLEVPPA